MLQARLYSWIKIVAVHLLLYDGAAFALKSVVLTGGGAVKSGGRATLRCSYDLEGSSLYSIRWYRNQEEFYRFVPKESPPTKVFSLPGIHVDLSASNDQRVTLTNVHRYVTGLFTCEVSADAPLFHTEIQMTRLEIVDSPQSAPLLTVDRLRYSAGDNIRANCSSPSSYPPANLTWYLNGEKVNKTHTTTIPLNPELWDTSSSFSVLEVGTEEQIPHPRYQVGGSQQEISSSQLKVPISSPEVTVYTAFSPIPKVQKENQREQKYYDIDDRRKVSSPESSAMDYPLRLNTIPLKITKIRLQPGFGGVVKLKCEATIYDIYKVSSEIVKIREETPHIALVMGQSSTGCINSYSLNLWLTIVASTSYSLTVWKMVISTR